MRKIQRDGAYTTDCMSVMDRQYFMRTDRSFQRISMPNMTVHPPPSSNLTWRKESVARPLEETFRDSLLINERINDRKPNSEIDCWRPNYRMRSDSGIECDSVSSSCSYDSLSSAISKYEYPLSQDSMLHSWEIPTLEEQLAIIQQVEYYFSDEYMARDAYFLRQVRRKREGYLSMKLITNFKKLRKMVNDPRVTAYCLRKSKLLQVNVDGTKVRRKAEVPRNIRGFRSQTDILVIGIPARLAKIEAIMAIFSRYGEMTSVRLIRPDKGTQTGTAHARQLNSDFKVKSDYLERMDNELRGKANAVIQFEEYESAISACRSVTLNRFDHGISKVIILENSCSRNGNHTFDDALRSACNDMPTQNHMKPSDLDWRVPSVNHRNFNHRECESHIPDKLKDEEENILDDAWIKSVVNQVLQQTYKQRMLPEKKTGEAKLQPPCEKPCSEDTNEYMFLHAM